MFLPLGIAVPGSPMLCETLQSPIEIKMQDTLIEANSELRDAEISMGKFKKESQTTTYHYHKEINQLKNQIQDIESQQSVSDLTNLSSIVKCLFCI